MSKGWLRGDGAGFNGAALIGSCFASVGLFLAGGVGTLIGALGFCVGIGLFWRYNQSSHKKLKAALLEQGYVEEEEGND